MLESIEKDMCVYVFYRDAFILTQTQHITLAHSNQKQMHLCQQ